MSIQTSLAFRYRTLQVVLLAVFLALLLLLHFRGRALREHEMNLRVIEQLLDGAEQQTRFAEELLNNAARRLAQLEEQAALPNSAPTEPAQQAPAESP